MSSLNLQPLTTTPKPSRKMLPTHLMSITVMFQTLWSPTPDTVAQVTRSETLARKKCQSRGGSIRDEINPMSRQKWWSRARGRSELGRQILTAVVDIQAQGNGGPTQSNGTSAQYQPAKNRENRALKGSPRARISSGTRLLMDPVNTSAHYLTSMVAPNTSAGEMDSRST